jgi:hypothetical protein
VMYEGRISYSMSFLVKDSAVQDITTVKRYG